MSIELITRMRGLKLYGMAAAWPELAAKARQREMEPDQWVGELLSAESAEREVKSQAHQMKAARFPAHRDLVGFDFAHCPIDEALVRRLHAGAFMDSAQNVVLIGGPGTGKMHLATAIGVEAVQRHHRRVRFLSTVELVNALEREKAAGKAGQIALRLTYADLVILDELGYLPFSQAGGALLFHLLSKLYERTSVLITTNLSFTEWASVFGDAKIGGGFHLIKGAQALHAEIKGREKRRSQVTRTKYEKVHASLERAVSLLREIYRLRPPVSVVDGDGKTYRRIVPNTAETPRELERCIRTLSTELP